MKQKGITPIVVVLIFSALFVVAGAGYWYSASNKKVAQEAVTQEKVALEEIAKEVTENKPEENKTKKNDGEVKIPINTDDISSKGWMKLESKELGISFNFPFLPGKVTYQFHDWTGGMEPSGVVFGWEIERSDFQLPNQPRKYTLAGGASDDFVIGRDRDVTDNIRWVKNQDKYIIEQSKNFNYRVTPLKVIERNDGTRALIFDPNESFWPKIIPPDIEPNKAGKAAILNFPSNYHSKLQSITFYFYDETPIEEIEKTISSVVFNKTN